MTTIVTRVGKGSPLTTVEMDANLTNLNTNKAELASPTFTGTPAAPTAAADTATTQLATTGYVLGQLSAVNPLMNGTVTIGTSTRFARADHVHPIDTSRAPLASPTFTGTVSGITKAMVGLSNVDNTSDLNKPVSTATQAAINAVASGSTSPSFTGTVTAQSLTVTANQTIGGTFGVTGATTLSTLSVSSTSSFTGAITASGGVTGNLTGTASASTLAVKASTLASGGSNGTAMTFQWNDPGSGGSYYWGGDNGTSMFVRPVSSMSVNYANSCGTASNSNAVNGISGWSYSNQNYNPPYLWATAGSGSSQFLVTPGNLSVNYSGSTGYVAWGNVAGAPTALSQFSNNIGAITNAGSALATIGNNGTSQLVANIGGTNSFWSVTPISDERVKENIVPTVEDSLAKIDGIKFISYNRNTLVPGVSLHTHKLGMLAQDLEKKDTEWVIDDHTLSPWKHLNPEELLIASMHAIQQLSTKIKTLEAALAKK